MDGAPSKIVASELGVHEHTVGKWRRRFLKDRIEGRLDEARPGRPRTIDADQVAALMSTRSGLLQKTPRTGDPFDSGIVIDKCYRRHRAAEFIDFLKQIDAQIPDAFDAHIVMDNYATHKTDMLKTWLAHRPHYLVHLAPTSASWINQIERWFAELTRK